MNETTNVTTKTFAQMRLEIMERDLYEFFAKNHGEEAAKAAVKKDKPRLENNIFPIILPDYLTKETLPDVDFLVTIGRPNLIKLRAIQRHKINDINEEIQSLQRTLEKVPPYVAMDDRHCNYNVITETGHLGKQCPYVCPFYQKHRQMFAQEELHASLKDGNTSNADYLKNRPITKLIAEQPCSLFNSAEDARIINERQDIIESMKREINEACETKKLHVKYLNRLTKAIHDKRTLPDLPLFVDWRPKNFLEENQVVCVFLDAKSETTPCIPRDSLTENLTDKHVSSGMKMFFCKITGPASSQINTGKGPLIFVSSHSEGPLKSGELYFITTCSLEQFLNHEITVEDAEFKMQYVPVIDQRIPCVMTINELLELKRHPEYAKIWAYTNYHAWHADPNEIEPMLEAIRELNI